ncbi:MAG: dihydrofolate reductase [Candidatus Ryanbacteria bacterium RIFCSPHIGHO2_02_FULL_45_43]|uniref:Dihydrofolate reductase n=1 Tax=Candidatus Ryanbacteria bacterium RIFCSPHIGHO2_01_45_13 TaxID=1802112 RepID=A0A1G2G1B3_9BACT|nr:MAG: dihydrofolate reductase [Candidatus Ryanbacteria bacterium RIFCSPHIGHO2_01_FULL_44_130]OGZ43650.1 MAG: dihydrofolate reductase [Candidatus Ryanbacteria bacterium RIFCSPHIGHO2_01_45_13]OGZ49133.1 MAG: dihydrofolate reductase [Candidatus Ryanbacteria bacterium RIFCSPHIGHO2_02_FULL_45_43]OGZ50914.1 MAG: dihydrofolate reductase [Candidatus Ryanbacteria bacterium RIFCSPHIGHO2_12_FULL_44_20]OGZ51393.1 MAG: dihydrofolate reductase [Candidatus Ryanbacteria bacterium RIFCSPLOWO2_01_FULL_44_230]
MIVSLIVAIDRKNLIGKDNALPWHLPADLKRFKEITMDHPMIMGRKTHESIGKTLPGRKNIVITTNQNYRPAKDCAVAYSLEEALQKARPANEVFIIGGAAIFKQALPIADRLYVTKVDHEFKGDVYFPDINRAEWNEIKKEIRKKDINNPYNLTFLLYKRRTLGAKQQ